MISLSHVKTRIVALLGSSIDGFDVLYGPATNPDDRTGENSFYRGFLAFGDRGGNVTGDIDRPESCHDPDTGWRETYELPLTIEVIAKTTDIGHIDIDQTRRNVLAAVLAAIPKVGDVADSDGYVTQVEVTIGGIETTTGTLPTDRGAAQAATRSTIELDVEAWIDATP